MDFNGKYQLLSIILFALVLECCGQINSNLQNEIKCTGDNVTLSWNYDTNNEVVVTWQFGSATIMTSVGGGAATKEAAYISRATHGGNGELTLAGLTKADAGTYTIGVTYSASPFSASDTVTVTVDDKITEESTPICDNNVVTCGNTSLTGVSYSWKVGDAVISDTSWSIKSRDGMKTYACTISGDRVTNCLGAGVDTTKATNCTFPGPPCDTTCIIIICVVVFYVLGIVAVLIVLAIVKKLPHPCPRHQEYTGIGRRAKCVIIATSLGMGIIVAVVILGTEKKLPCQKGSKNKKPDSGNSGDKKIERPSKVNEKKTKPLSPSTIALTNEAKPGGRALPPIPQHEKKKKNPRKKKKRVKTEDGEDTEKLPPIQKKERNIEHYTRDTQDSES